MWGILVTEVLVTCINKTTQEGQSLLILLTSLLLTVMTCFYGIIKGIDEKQETLIDEVTHYVRNVYPLELKKQQNVSRKRGINWIQCRRNYLQVQAPSASKQIIIFCCCSPTAQLYVALKVRCPY